MHCSILLACTAFFSAVRSANPGFTQQNGRTRLLGSSFGVLGLNATFDYVVRKRLLLSITFLTAR